MSANRLDRITAKITRAEQHLRDFQLGLSAFYESKPYAIAIKEDAQRGKRIYYAAKVDCVPDSLTAIAADVIQNLRSPLDHIAHQLVLDARGGTEPEWLVYYPFTSKATEYQARRTGVIKGVRQEVIDAIDATEPYPGGKGHTLWQLNELNKPDKHELLIGATTFSPGVDLTVDIKDMVRPEDFLNVPGLANAPDLDRFFAAIPAFYVKESSTVPLKVGDEIYIESINDKMQKDRRFSFSVSFNAPGVLKPEPAIKTLQDMANLVRHIVETLGKLLA